MMLGTENMESVADVLTHDVEHLHTLTPQYKRTLAFPASAVDSVQDPFPSLSVSSPATTGGGAQQSHDKCPAAGFRRPSPTQPFGEFVATSMFLGDRNRVAQVVACVATLYMTRSDPETLKSLRNMFVELFPKYRDEICARINGVKERRVKLKEDTRRSVATASEAATSSSSSSAAGKEYEVKDIGGGCSRSTTNNSPSMAISKSGLFDVSVTDPSAIDNYLFSTTHELIMLYFGFNWDKVERILELNREYVQFVERELIPALFRNETTTSFTLGIAPGELSSVETLEGEPSFTAGGLGTEAVGFEDGDGGSMTPPPLTTMGEQGCGNSSPQDTRMAPWQQTSSSSGDLVAAGSSVQIAPPSPSSMVGRTSEASVASFINVTETSLDTLADMCTDQGKDLVLFFHVPFSQPSCKMWESLEALSRRWAMHQGSSSIVLTHSTPDFHQAQQQQQAFGNATSEVDGGESMSFDACSSEAAQYLHHQHPAPPLRAPPQPPLHPPVLGVVHGIAELHLVRDFEVTWFPTLVLIPANRVKDVVNNILQRTTMWEIGTNVTDSSSNGMPCPNSNEGTREYRLSRENSKYPSSETSATTNGAAARQDSSVTVSSSSLPPLGAAAAAAAASLPTLSDMYFRFPEKGLVLVDALEEWISGHGLVAARQRKFKAFVTRVAALTAQEKFKNRRTFHSVVLMLQRLQCHVDIDESKTYCSAEDPPRFVFLGGGMAAGKTTAATALINTPWWIAHKDHLVVVDADSFKTRDPLVNTAASDIHQMSTTNAESLLVHALNQGRSITFDGTMMWRPFVEQTIAMIREAHEWIFSRGPGFNPDMGIEEYWTKQSRREKPLPAPYRVDLLAITVEPGEAVPRGILRAITTGRSVPIKGQLRSFRLFSTNFPRYVELSDVVTLYNNNIRVDLSKGELPPVILHRDLGQTESVVEDKAAYDQFLKHRFINDNATCVNEIYLKSNSPTMKLKQHAA